MPENIVGANLPSNIPPQLPIQQTSIVDTPVTHDTGPVFPEPEPVLAFQQRIPDNANQHLTNQNQEPLLKPIKPQTEPLIAIPPEFWTYIQE